MAHPYPCQYEPTKWSPDAATDFCTCPKIRRKPEHVQRAREIMALEHQDALAVIGELLAEVEAWRRT